MLNISNIFNKLIIKDTVFNNLLEDYRSVTNSNMEYKFINSVNFFNVLGETSNELLNLNTVSDQDKVKYKEIIANFLYAEDKSLLKDKIYLFFLFTNDNEQSESLGSLINFFINSDNFYKKINEENPFLDDQFNIKPDNIPPTDFQKINERFKKVDEFLSITLTENDKKVKEILRRYSLL